MKIHCLLWMLLLFALVSHGQLPDYFEFLDQDARGRHITNISEFKGGIIYTTSGGSNDEYATRVFFIQDDGTPVLLFNSYSTHENSKIFIPNDSLALILILDQFECDYPPPGFVLISFDGEATSVQYLHDQVPYVDAVLHDSDSLPKLITLSYDHNKSAIQFHSLEGMLLETQDLARKTNRIYIYGNEIYGISDLDEVYQISNDSTILSNMGVIKDFQVFDNKVLIVADQLFVFDHAIGQLARTIAYDPDRLETSGYGRTITKYDDDLLFYMHDDHGTISVFKLTEGDDFIEWYREPYEGLNLEFLKYENDQFLTGFQLDFHGIGRVIRKTPSLEDHAYDRVDLELVDIDLHQSFIDTFYVGGGGDSTFYTLKELHVAVTILNHGDSTINYVTFHSLPISPHGWDCGYNYLEFSHETPILPMQSARVETNTFFSTDPDLISVYLAGADYKLDSDLSDNVVSAILLGTLDQPGRIQLTAFPNPASDQYIIELEEMGDYEIQVMDVKGQLISYFELEGSQNINLDVSTYPSGLYFITLSNSRDRTSIPMVKI